MPLYISQSGAHDDGDSKFMVGINNDRFILESERNDSNDLNVNIKDKDGNLVNVNDNLLLNVVNRYNVDSLPSSSVTYDFSDGVTKFVNDSVQQRFSFSVSDGAQVLEANENTGNAYARAYLDFSSISNDATTLVVEYDTKYDGGRWNIGLVELSKRPGTSNMLDYDTTGVVYYAGINDSLNQYYINGSTTFDTSLNNVWVHTKLNINMITRTVNYNISSNGMTNYTGQTIYNSDITTIDGLEVYTWIQGTAYIDNIKITASYSVDENGLYITPDGEYIYKDGEPKKIGGSSSGGIDTPEPSVDSAIQTVSATYEDSTKTITITDPVEITDGKILRVKINQYIDFTKQKYTISVNSAEYTPGFNQYFDYLNIDSYISEDKSSSPWYVGTYTDTIELEFVTKSSGTGHDCYYKNIVSAMSDYAITAHNLDVIGVENENDLMLTGIDYVNGNAGQIPVYGTGIKYSQTNNEIDASSETTTGFKLGICDSSITSNIKEVTIDNILYRDGEKISVRFTNGFMIPDSGTVSVKINGGTEYPLRLSKTMDLTYYFENKYPLYLCEDGDILDLTYHEYNNDSYFTVKPALFSMEAEFSYEPMFPYNGLITTNPTNTYADSGMVIPYGTHMVANADIALNPSGGAFKSLLAGISVLVSFTNTYTKVDPKMSVKLTDGSYSTAYPLYYGDNPVMPGMLAKGRVYRFTYFANKWHVTGGKVEPHTRYVSFVNEYPNNGNEYATIYSYDTYRYSSGNMTNLPYPLIFTIDSNDSILTSDDLPDDYNVDDLRTMQSQSTFIISGDLLCPSVIIMGGEGIDHSLNISIRRVFDNNSNYGDCRVDIDIKLSGAHAGNYTLIYRIRTISNPGYDEPDTIQFNNETHDKVYRSGSYLSDYDGTVYVNALAIPEHEETGMYLGDSKVLTENNITELKIRSNSEYVDPVTYETLTYQDIQTIHNLSNGSADDNIVFGVYEGNGQESRTINLGFRPAAVEVYRVNGEQYSQSGSPGTSGGLAIDGYPCAYANELSDITDLNKCIEIVDNGFMVRDYYKSQSGNNIYVKTNQSGDAYYFKAYRKAKFVNLINNSSAEGNIVDIGGNE